MRFPLPIFLLIPCLVLAQDPREECYKLILAEEIEAAYCNRQLRPMTSRDIYDVMVTAEDFLEEHNLPYTLIDVLALAGVESRFDRMAIGPFGEIGIFQILHHKIVLKIVGGQDPHDAVTNTRMGLTVLLHKYQKYGSVKKGVIAYNGIIKTPDGWKEDYWHRFQREKRRILMCEGQAHRRLQAMFRYTRYQQGRRIQ